MIHKGLHKKYDFFIFILIAVSSLVFAGCKKSESTTQITISGQARIGDGMSENITVSLIGGNSATPVTVTISSSDTGRVVVDAPTITFSGSNFYVPQTVIITGIVGLSDAPVNISASANGLQTANLPLQFFHSPQISTLSNGVIPQSGFGALFTVDRSDNVFTFSGGSGGNTDPATGVVKMTPDGVMTSFFTGRYSFVTARDYADNIYVYSFASVNGGISDPQINVISPSGSISLFNTGINPPGSHTGGFVDSLGNIISIGTNSKSIISFSSSGVGTVIAGANVDSSSCPNGTGANAKFKGISGFALDSADNIYVVDSIDQSGTTDCAASIRKITPDGVVTTIYTFPNGETPNGSGLAIDGDGNLYFPMYTGYSATSGIKKLTQAGVLSTYCGGAPTNTEGTLVTTGSCSKTYFPSGVIGFDSAGNLIAWVQNSSVQPNTYVLQKISP